MMRGILATVVAVAVLATGFVLIRNGAFNSTPTASPTTPASPLPNTTPTPIPTASPTPSPTPSPSPVPTPVDTSVVANGVVVPLRSADLAARVTGVVAAVYVQEGDQAAANELLVKLDQSTYLDAIDVAEAVMFRATVAVEQAQLQVDQLPLDASQSEIDFVQANLNLAQAELTLARTTLNEAHNALLQTEVRAPFGGTIANVNVEVGEQAVAGQAVIVIGDISGWLIEATDVPELEIVRLVVGDRATLTFDALPAPPIGGTVDSIEIRGRTAEGSVVYAISIRPDTHNPDLRWGMTANVRIAPSR
jgi:HlyD family secretion protein